MNLWSFLVMLGVVIVGLVTTAAPPPAVQPSSHLAVKPSGDPIPEVLTAEWVVERATPETAASPRDVWWLEVTTRGDEQFTGLINIYGDADVPLVKWLLARRGRTVTIALVEAP